MITSLCMFGDSLAKGVVLDAGTNKYQFLKDCFVSSFVRRTGIVVDNFARFGCTIKKGLELAQKNKNEMALSDYTILEFGGNDCDFDWAAISEKPDDVHLCKTPMFEFLALYEKLVDLIKSVGGRPALMNLPPIYAKKYFSWVSRGLNANNILRWLGDVEAIFRWHEGYSVAVCNLAERKKVPLLDIRSAFMRDAHYEDLLCADGIHPNARGHALLCDTVSSFVPA